MKIYYKITGNHLGFYKKLNWKPDNVSLNSNYYDTENGFLEFDITDLLNMPIMIEDLIGKINGLNYEKHETGLRVEINEGEKITLSNVLRLAGIKIDFIEIKTKSAQQSDTSETMT